jgi:1,4-alpha-glucan branching enzyme
MAAKKKGVGSGGRGVGKSPDNAKSDSPKKKGTTKKSASKRATSSGKVEGESPYADPAAQSPKPTAQHRPRKRPSMPISEGQETASDVPVTFDIVRNAYAAVQARAIKGAKPPPIDPTREGRRTSQRGGRRSGDQSGTIVIPAHLIEAPITSPIDASPPVTARDVRRVYRNSLERARRPSTMTTRPAPPMDLTQRGLILAGLHNGPHGVLGAHPAEVDGDTGIIVRAHQPNAQRAELIVGHEAPLTLHPEGDGLFASFFPGESLPVSYRLRFHFADEMVWERDDPYRFLPTIGDVDLHLFNEGTHRRLWTKLGAHPIVHDGVEGTAFAVWAPNARRVSVVGEFCGWDGRVYPMRNMGHSGVWEIFIPELRDGALYKFELVTREGMIRVKTDPFAFKMEQMPGTASIVQRDDQYDWGDAAWMERRGTHDLTREPMLVYEVHLGSWARVPEDGNRPLTYREIAPRLAEHVTNLGFTHIELMPVMEHPFYGSWGYQVSGYFAPTSRYGTPDDFRYFVDVMHQHGIGVILDWVPAHFPKDDYALRRFDGTALYEHEDPRLGEHPDWGTLIFNYGRNEVRNFLVANALYWLIEFHVDGLRVDAVASMLYLDYSRQAGEWLRNRHGGRENLDAIDFLRQFNDMIHAEAPGCITVAEESTAWPGVTKPGNEGGLGFTLKWNMGWMHDTLNYFEKDPVYRRHHQDQLTFAMIYEYSERFVMPLSHDEVVHLKGSLLAKMPGDEWQKFANLRALVAYMYTRPGKALLFMGTELAPWSEWNHDTSLDWHLLEDPQRQALCRFMTRLGAVYRDNSPLWRYDGEWRGFSWIDADDRENSVLSFVRWDNDKHVVVVMNLTPVPREHYRIGAPSAGTYRELISSDAAEWGGSGYSTPSTVETDPTPFHGYQQSLALTLPPLGVVVLAPE